jgi:retron-type reverse transcriptase
VLLETADTAPRYYRPFIKSGLKPRTIDNPTGLLKVIQARIQRTLLAKIPLPSEIQGGVAGRSPVTNAAKHLKTSTVVTLDIRKCFPSITNKHVFRAWRNVLGCSPTLARILTKLTTFERHLPQGTPTSTTLANIVLSVKDQEIKSLCKARNLTYTRFVDDLVFSGEYARSVINDVVKLLKADGFRTPHAKIKIMGAKRRHQITGIVANRKLGVTRARKGKIRALIHNLKKSKNSEAELISLVGRIGFVSQVNPVTGRYFKKLLSAALPEGSRDNHNS